MRMHPGQSVGGNTAREGKLEKGPSIHGEGRMNKTDRQGALERERCNSMGGIHLFIVDPEWVYTLGG